MHKLGLIGGTGPESTIEYYRQIEYGVQQRTGAFPPLAIESLSVFDVLRLCDAGDYAGLADYLVAGFRNLAAAGAELGALTGITPHAKLLLVRPFSRLGSTRTLVGMSEAGALGGIGEEMCEVLAAHGHDLVPVERNEARNSRRRRAFASACPLGVKG